MIATLDNLVVNDNGLRLFCNSCVRCVDLEVNALVERYGAAISLPEIGRRGRCKACGAKGGSVAAANAIVGENGTALHKQMAYQ